MLLGTHPHLLVVGVGTPLSVPGLAILEGIGVFGKEGGVNSAYSIRAYNSCRETIYRGILKASYMYATNTTISPRLV
jgi:hypothetical protein